MRHHAVGMICYNNLELTKAAVESVWAQDIGEIHLQLIDNGSTDGTREWMQKLVAPPRHRLLKPLYYDLNQSPVYLANMMMWDLFHSGYDKLLGIPNDVVLPPNMYRKMAEYPRGVVTASMNPNMDFVRTEDVHAVNQCTPMAVCMIREWVWQALMSKDGYCFDEGFFHYASDCDFALRLAACGINGIQLDLQYWHYGSASWRLATPEIGAAINVQADIDRAYFEKKWGFKVSDPQYGLRAADINFKG